MLMTCVCSVAAMNLSVGVTSRERAMHWRKLEDSAITSSFRVLDGACRHLQHTELRDVLTICAVRMQCIFRHTE